MTAVMNAAGAILFIWKEFHQMARENTIMLVGEVSKAPTVFYNEVHQNFRMAFAVKTVRRNGRIDYPRVNVYGLTEQEAKEY